MTWFKIESGLLSEKALMFPTCLSPPAANCSRHSLRVDGRRGLELGPLLAVLIQVDAGVLFVSLEVEC